MKNKKSIIMLIVSIFTFLVMIGVFILFMRIIKNKNIHTSAVLSTLESKMIEKENFNVLESKVKEIKVTNEKINSYFLNKDQADLFVIYLENLGLSFHTQVAVKSIEVSTVNKDTMMLKIEINGSFDNILKTVSLLENAPYNIFINSAYLNKEIISASVNTAVNAPKIINTSSNWSAEVGFGILSKK